MSNKAAHGPHWKGRNLDGLDLEDFRNNGMSAGLDGYISLKRSTKDNNGIIIEHGRETRWFTDIIINFVGKEFFDKIYSCGPGNPITIEHLGYQLTDSDITAVYNAALISRYLRAPKHIVEIGPGYGALAANLRKLFPETAITLVDLPEHHKMQAYYLEQTVGLDGFTITDELPDDADVVIALRCIMEMTHQEAAKYMDWVQSRPSLEWFYIASRYTKVTILKDLPFDAKWVPLISQQDIFLRGIHEMILKRIDQNNGNFLYTLKCLPPFRGGKKYYEQTTGNITIMDAR